MAVAVFLVKVATIFRPVVSVSMRATGRVCQKT
jgi:hypothetical protein